MQPRVIRGLRRDRYLDPDLSWHWTACEWPSCTSGASRYRHWARGAGTETEEPAQARGIAGRSTPVPSPGARPNWRILSTMISPGWALPRNVDDKVASEPVGAPPERAVQRPHAFQDGMGQRGEHGDPLVDLAQGKQSQGIARTTSSGRTSSSAGSSTASIPVWNARVASTPRPLRCRRPREART